MKDLRSAHNIASLAVTHATYGTLSSIQIALLQHFMDGALSKPDLQIVSRDLGSAIELLENAAFMLRYRQHDCLEALEAESADQ